jgi:hypothetical protein
MTEPLNVAQQMTDVGERLLTALADVQLPYSSIEQLLEQRNELFHALRKNARLFDPARLQTNDDFRLAMQKILDQNEQICLGIRARQHTVQQAGRQVTAAGKFAANRFSSAQQSSSFDIQL